MASLYQERGRPAASCGSKWKTDLSETEIEFAQTLHLKN